MSLCLPCYHVAMENSRETKKNNGPLPEFHELFCHEYQKEKHIHDHQNGRFGPNEASFVSGNDRNFRLEKFFSSKQFRSIMVKSGKRKIQVLVPSQRRPKKTRKRGRINKPSPKLRFLKAKRRPRPYNLVLRRPQS